MALETLTAQTASRTGAEVALQAVTTAGGFEFPNTGRTLLFVLNDAGAAALTFAIVTTVDGEAVATKDVTVTASQLWVIGPFPTDWYNDSSGNVTSTTDDDLTPATGGVAVIKF